MYACVYLNGHIAIILCCVYFTELLHCVVGPICQAWWEFFGQSSSDRYHAWSIRDCGD